jgi:hypothetical protein
MMRYGLTVEAFPAAYRAAICRAGSPRECQLRTPGARGATAGTAHGLEPELLGPLVLALLAQLSHYTDLVVLH